MMGEHRTRSLAVVEGGVARGEREPARGDPRGSAVMLVGSHDRRPSPFVGLGSDPVDGTIRALLEAFPTAAFVVRSDGSVLLANARGAVELAAATLEQQRGFGDLSRLERSVVHPLPAGADGLSRALVVRKPDAAASTAERLARVGASWELTDAQAAVLSMLVHGEPNKVIAERRGCAVRTIEVHVTSLLEKSKTSCRAALVARFWSSTEG